MREIEFRGFHVCDGPDEVRNPWRDGAVESYRGEWLTGSLVRWDDGTAWILRRDPDDDNDHMTRYVVLPETVGEWTGYVDKNGRQIYEGDRVAFRKGIIPTLMTYWVELHKGVWCARDLEGMDFLSSVAGVCEVIGTVYDPEVTGAAE